MCNANPVKMCGMKSDIEIAKRWKSEENESR